MLKFLVISLFYHLFWILGIKLVKLVHLVVKRAIDIMHDYRDPNLFLISIKYRHLQFIVLIIDIII